MVPARAFAPAPSEGAPCWADAQLPDVEAGKRFYGDLFGWTFDEGAGAERGYYTAAYLGDRAVAALAPLFGSAGPAWTVHFAVRDAYTTAARVTRSGGGVVTGPLSVGTAATMALATDRDGGLFGLWQPGSDLGFEVTGEPGAFCWADVRARDSGRADTFYETVFSYAAVEAGAGLRLWAPAGSLPGPRTAVAGRHATAATPVTRRFLVHFGADGLEATVADAVRLGGETRIAPHTTPHGRVAVLADDQGALFAVREL
ncbi:VOC family protein [Streptomyces sp. SID8379]|uniref:VOC family protein n=1 Tax=unclassified Streptomyces TaxID=2593676 RepID=UPI00035D1E92|nr:MULTISPECIES: VOC family protein [unclassified Streptomyces]MYW68067.1 VOC family protein [Streptomyces sp. SID8379]